MPETPKSGKLDRNIVLTTMKKGRCWISVAAFRTFS
jgi:hypothetical protein